MIVNLSKTKDVEEEMFQASRRFAENAVLLMRPLLGVNPDESTHLPGAAEELQLKANRLLQSFDRLFGEALSLALEIRMKHIKTSFFWPSPNSLYDHTRMTPDNHIVTNEKVFQGQRILLALLPGVVSCADGRILSKARVMVPG